MIHLKSEQEIEIMKECGKRLRASVQELLPFIQPGITTLSVDQEAEGLIIKNGAESSFNKVPGYRWSTCLPVNEQAVHTPPSGRKLKEGDVLTIDIGAYYQGFHTDYATTVVVGDNTTPQIEDFLETGKKTLKKAIAVVKRGTFIGEISRIMERGITSKGYHILKELTGHGVGRELHEDPYVPNFVDRPMSKTFKIPSGLVIAVEVIYSMGSDQIAFEKSDGWTIRSKDRSICACFEHTIAIQDENTFILT